MLLNLKPFFAGEASEESFQYAMALPQDMQEGTYRMESPVQVTGKVECRADGVMLTATVEYSYRTSCDRCATEISGGGVLSVEHQLVQQLQEDTDDYIVVEAEPFDLDKLLQDDLLLAIPTKILCKEDCKGICPVCGKNRNEEDCTCQAKKIDPRLALLQQLLEED